MKKMEVLAMFIVLALAIAVSLVNVMKLIFSFTKNNSATKGNRELHSTDYYPDENEDSDYYASETENVDIHPSHSGGPPHNMQSRQDDWQLVPASQTSTSPRATEKRQLLSSAGAGNSYGAPTSPDSAKQWRSDTYDKDLREYVADTYTFNKEVASTQAREEAELLLARMLKR